MFDDEAARGRSLVYDTARPQIAVTFIRSVYN